MSPVARAEIKLEPSHQWGTIGPEVVEFFRDLTNSNIRRVGRQLSVDEISGLTSSWLATWDRTSHGPIVSDCSTGCNVCCQRYIDVIVPEALVVYNYLLALSDKSYKPIFERLQEHVKTLGKDSSEYVEGCHTCPFNDPNTGACDVYPARPLPEADARTWHLGGAMHAGFRRGLADNGYHVDSVVLPWAVWAMLKQPQLITRWTVGENSFASVRARY
jgi:hypothetical protein